MIVVSDTTPLHYLVLIDQVQLIAELYGRATVPPAVVRELSHASTPPKIRNWVEHRPEWIDVRAPSIVPGDLPSHLGPGECEAIALSHELRAGALLIEDFDGRSEARRRGFVVIGSLRIQADAARKGLIYLPDALERLRATQFRASDALFEAVLQELANPGTG